MKWMQRITNNRLWYYYFEPGGKISGVVVESTVGDHYHAEWWEDNDTGPRQMLFLWEQAAKDWVEAKYEEHIRKENTDADADKS